MGALSVFPDLSGCTGVMAILTYTQGSSNVAFVSQSRVPQTLIAAIIPATIASILVLARFYSRVFIMKNWGYDDSWILLSWVRQSIRNLAYLLMREGHRISRLDHIERTSHGPRDRSTDIRRVIAHNEAGICKPRTISDLPRHYETGHMRFLSTHLSRSCWQGHYQKLDGIYCSFHSCPVDGYYFSMSADIWYVLMIQVHCRSEK